MAGAHTAKVAGAVALESAAAAVGLAGRGGVTLRAGGALALAAGGGHQTTGAKVELRPRGGPAVGAPAVPAAASAFRAPALPPAGRLRHTGEVPPKRPAAKRVKANATWVELEYTNADDGSPMAGASYRARFADGSTKAGTLDARGRARLDSLSPVLAGMGVDVRLGEPGAEFLRCRRGGVPMVCVLVSRNRGRVRHAVSRGRTLVPPVARTGVGRACCARRRPCPAGPAAEPRLVAGTPGRAAR